MRRGISIVKPRRLSLSLDSRLRICYLFSICYFQTLNSKKIWTKDIESKVYQSFSGFLNFSDSPLKFGAHYFQSNLVNVANTQIEVHDTNFFLKIRKNQWFERSSKKGKLLQNPPGIRTIFIFARPLIYESFLL